jgi:hypothetical protein
MRNYKCDAGRLHYCKSLRIHTRIMRPDCPKLCDNTSNSSGLLGRESLSVHP